MLSILAVLAGRARADDRKDPATATVISVGATLGGFGIGVALADQQETIGGVVLVGAMIIAPSAGHAYAGDMNWIGLWGWLA